LSPHLSKEIIERFRASDLTPVELLAFDDHLEHCGSCRAQLRDRETFSEGYAQAISALRPESGLADAHLAYQQMADYVDDTVSEVDREIIDSHLELCRSCRAEVKDLEATKASLALPPRGAVSTRKSPGLGDRLAAWWQLPAIRIPIQVAAAIILVVAAIWLATLFLHKPEQEAQEHPGAGEQNQPTPNNSPVVPAPEEQKTVPLVADLVDAGTHITLSSDDKLAGLESASVRVQIEAASALKSGRVKASPFVAELKGQAGKLMGAGSSDYGLVSPVAVVIESRTPTFRWRPIAGAENYVVTIYDSNSQKIAESPPLNETNWKVNALLERGRVYTWQVRANKQGEEVLMPPPAAAAAKFRIIDGEKADELAQVRRSQGSSHLVLGLTYADAGMLDESEQEFRKLLAANPDSTIVRSLLRSVEAQKSSK
jgi:hypothetical protein